MSRSTVYLKPPPLNCTLMGFKCCSARRNYKINQQASWLLTFLLICIVSDNHVFAWCFYINAFLTFIANSTDWKEEDEKKGRIKRTNYQTPCYIPTALSFHLYSSFFHSNRFINNYKPSQAWFSSWIT